MGRKTRISFCRNINSGETIETIGDITRKNSLIIQTITNEAEQEWEKC
jgi:hypothetical protein